MGTTFTEEKFNEFLVIFENRMSGLENRMSGIEKRMSSLEKTVKDIKGFQDHESNAIEYELEMILKTHLNQRFPLNDIEDFPMKHMYGIYGEEITEMDAAFLITPHKPKYNYSRLTRNEMYIMLPMKYVPTDKYKFVLAEAKHHINTKKIKQKLQQFHKLRQLFGFAQRLTEHPEIDVASYSTQFIDTVKHHPFMANMDTDACYLYFGAAYWDKGLLERFKQVIEEYKSLALEFEMMATKPERKITIYRKLCKLEHNWFPVLNVTLLDTEILEMTKIDSIYNLVELILPSGQRFHIPADKGPEGYMRGGGSHALLNQNQKTRKLSKNIS